MIFNPLYRYRRDASTLHCTSVEESASITFPSRDTLDAVIELLLESEIPEKRVAEVPSHITEIIESLKNAGLVVDSPQDSSRCLGEHGKKKDVFVCSDRDISSVKLASLVAKAIPESSESLPPRDISHGLTIAISIGGNCSFALDMHRRAIESRREIIPVIALDGKTLCIGPVWKNADGACLDCFLMELSGRFRSNSAEILMMESALPTDHHFQDQVLDVCVGVVAMCAMNYLSDDSSIRRRGDEVWLISTNIGVPEVKRHRVWKQPNCRGCCDSVGFQLPWNNLEDSEGLRDLPAV